MSDAVIFGNGFVLGPQYHRLGPPEVFGFTTWAEFVTPPEDPDGYPYQFILRPQDYGGQRRLVGHGLRDYTGLTTQFMGKHRPILALDSSEAPPVRPAVELRIGVQQSDPHAPPDLHSCPGDNLGLYYLPEQPPEEITFVNWPSGGVPSYWSSATVPACKPAHLSGPFWGIETRIVPLINTEHLNPSGMTYFQLRGLAENTECFWNVYQPGESSPGWPKFDELAISQYWAFATFVSVVGWGEQDALTVTPLAPGPMSGRTGRGGPGLR